MLHPKAAILFHKERTDLLEVEAVRDVISSHEGSQQMGDGTGLTTVRPEHERVHPPLSGKQKINTFYTIDRTHVLRGTYCSCYCQIFAPCDKRKDEI